MSQAAAQEGKKASKTIVNEKVFGKAIDHNNPKGGISGTRIRANDVGNIPGAIEHWSHEIEERKKDILRVSKRSFVKRAMGVLGKSDLQNTVSGEELLKFSPTKTNEELVSRLKHKPDDAYTRLELVSSVGKKGGEPPVELFRAMLLQSLVACSLGQLSTQGLKITMWSQSQYFSKLHEKCKESLERLNKGLTGAHVMKGEPGQREAIEKQIEEVQRNVNILRLYQNHMAKLQEVNGECSISLKEIQNFFLSFDGKEQPKEEKQKLVKKLTAVVSILRFIILLHPIAHEILDLFIKLDANNPIGYFLKGRVSMSAMNFSISRFEGGDRSKKTRQEIQDCFKDTYHQYGLAVKRVGTSPKGTTQNTIMIEYAQSICFFYLTARNLLGIKLPKDWIRSALSSANKSLQNLEDLTKCGSLQKRILKIMEHEGC